MDVIADTANGLIRGIRSVDYGNEDFYCFYGVPYAKPPLGNLRFKAPEAVENWTGILDCTKVKPGCISLHIFTLKPQGSEDCLFLNIYTKELPTKTNPSNNLKSVFVWIHGGGLLAGSGNPDLFGPEFLITEDIVIVTINYRLGPLGFLCLEDNDLEIYGNAGLKDILMALKWINKNIKFLNGDPENITLCGQCSGAAVVYAMMITPLAKGLFHKAILQSGSIFHEFTLGTRNMAEELAGILGFKSKNERELLNFLRSVSAFDLNRATIKMRNISTDLSINVIHPFGMVIENPNPGAILTELPLISTIKNEYRKMPVLMGYTDQEGLYCIFIIRKLKVILDDFRKMVPYSLHLNPEGDLTKRLAKKIQNFYFGNEIVTNQHQGKYMKMMGEVFLKYPSHRAARFFKKQSDQPIYFYQFSMDTKLNVFKHIRKCYEKGASHSDDTCYLFKTMSTPEIERGSIEEMGMKRMVAIWGNFTKTGNPGIEGWKPLGSNEMNYMDITNDGLFPGKDLDKEAMEFWDGIYRNGTEMLNHKM